MIKKLLMSILLCLYLVTNLQPASAEIKTVTATGEHILTLDIDDTSARELARQQAKRSAIEKSGIYIKSYTEAHNFTITKEELTIIAGNILEITNESFHMKPSADQKSVTIVCTLTATIDTSKIDMHKLAEEKATRQKLEEQEQRIQELERRKAELNQSNAALQQKIAPQPHNGPLSINEILNAELTINPYNYSCNKSIAERLALAQRLLQQDPQNASALNFMLAYYRGQGDRAKVESLCQQLLAPNTSAELKIIAYAQLASMYFYDQDNSALAKTYVEQGITLARNTYNADTINTRVNHTNVKVDNFILTGSSNAMRELYILQNILEEMPPALDTKTVIEEAVIATYDEIYNVEYKTDLPFSSPYSQRSDNHPSITLIGQALPPICSITPAADAKKAAILEAYSQLSQGDIRSCVTTVADLVDHDILNWHYHLPLSAELQHKAKITHMQQLPDGSWEVRMRVDKAVINAMIDKWYQKRLADAQKLRANMPVQNTTT